MRTREVWIHAVDLDNGCTFRDFPSDLLDALLADITGTWRQRGNGPDLTLIPTDRKGNFNVGANPIVQITGAAADLTRWATGRGASGIAVVGDGTIPWPRRWL